MKFMTGMVLLSVLILAVTTLFVVRSGMVTLSFNHKTLDGILGDLKRKVTHLEELAREEEQNAADFLEAHLNSKEIVTKARNAATNIGKLFG
jgi:hypothetical protein